MSDFTLSPNMSLPIPVVGQEQGPDYAQDINNALTLVDAHDHTPGSGVLITPYAMNINTSLTFNNQLAINLAGVSFEAQGSTADVSTIYEKGVDLYFVDGLGNDVRITQDGGIAGTPGSISNLDAPASASYVAGSSTFVWQSGTNIAANMDIGSLLLRNLSPNSTFALTLAPPAGLSSNFSITLPTLPGAQSFLTINNSGTIQAAAAFSGGLVNANLANETITAAKIAPTTITGDRLVNNTIGFTQLNNAVFGNHETTYVIAAASFAVRVATTVNGTLSTAFHNASVVDGVTLATNDLILIKNQTLASENGVYVVQASGSPVRSTSYDSVDELNGAGVIVTAGTVNTGKSFYQNTYLTSLSDLQVWSESQTYLWTIPSTGITSIEYEMCGGGGGSAGVRAGGGGSGGGGGALKSTGFMSVAAGDVISLTVGAGGAAGATSGGAGGNGSPSIITDNTSGVSVIAAGGGAGGAGGVANTTAATDGGGVVSAGGAAGQSDSAGVAPGGGGGSSLGPGGGGNGFAASSGVLGLAAYPYSGGGGGGGISSNTGGAGASTAAARSPYGNYAGGAGGTGTTYCGGGGGGGPYGVGGNGGAASAAGTAAAANTGAGAGGPGGNTARVGAKGGSGKIIIRYYGS